MLIMPLERTGLASLKNTGVTTPRMTWARSYAISEKGCIRKSDTATLLARPTSMPLFPTQVKMALITKWTKQKWLSIS
jgi:hypothetical protein